MFVGIYRMVGIDTATPSLEGGEKLCEAYEIYREWEPDSPLQFDYSVLLATGAVTGEKISLSRCAQCGCALLIDKRGIPRTSCWRCRKSKKSSGRGP